MNGRSLWTTDRSVQRKYPKALVIPATIDEIMLMYVKGGSEMKGLLLKDFYIVRAVAALMGIVFIVIGACMSYIVTPWVLTVIATVMLGMIVTSTINVDKTSGWIRNVMAMPVSRRTFISSKYILYLILSLTGLVFGTFFWLYRQSAFGRKRRRGRASLSAPV